MYRVVQESTSARGTEQADTFLLFVRARQATAYDGLHTAHLISDNNIPRNDMPHLFIHMCPVKNDDTGANDQSLWFRVYRSFTNLCLGTLSLFV